MWSAYRVVLTSLAIVDKYQCYPISLVPLSLVDCLLTRGSLFTSSVLLKVFFSFIMYKTIITSLSDENASGGRGASSQPTSKAGQQLTMAAGRWSTIAGRSSTRFFNQDRGWSTIDQPLTGRLRPAVRLVGGRPTSSWSRDDRPSTSPVGSPLRVGGLLHKPDISTHFAESLTFQPSLPENHIGLTKSLNQNLEIERDRRVS